MHSFPPITLPYSLRRVATTAAFALLVILVFPRTARAATEVEGVVETLNDALYLPYDKTNTTTGTITTLATTFIVPVGYRLVVETVTFRAKVPNGEPVLVHFVTHNSTGYLAAQSQVRLASGETYHVATHPLRLRVDEQTDAPHTNAAELVIFCTRIANTGGSADFRVSVHGYLVPLT